MSIKAKPGPKLKRKYKTSNHTRVDAEFGGMATKLAILNDEDEKQGDQPSLDENATLSQFFERWFVPRVLKPKEVCSSTLKTWRETIQCWKFLTNDPPLRLVTGKLCDAFHSALKEAIFRRGLQGKPFKLAPFTQRRHLRHLRTLLVRAAQTIDPSRPGAGLIAQPPAVPSVKVTHERKPAFTLEQARRIAAACNTMIAPPMPPNMSVDVWWKASLALLYYTRFETRHD